MQLNYERCHFAFSFCALCSIIAFLLTVVVLLLPGVQAGVGGIIVSDHGARQADACVPAMEALPAVVRAAKGRVPVFVDSGIRTGGDVMRAIALGAKAVLLGRHILWCVAV